MDKFDEDPIIMGGRVEKETHNLKFVLENK